MTTNLASRLAAVNERLVHATIEFEFANVRAAAGDHDAELADAEVRACDVAAAALHSVRDVVSAQVAETIANVCSEALRLVFADPSLRLEARSVERRSVVETDLVLIKGDGMELSPLESSGGGLVSVASAVLRLTLVRLMARRGLAPLVILDEPLAALSEGHREQMSAVLHDVAADLGVQVVIVSHEDAFVRDTVYRVEWENREQVLARVVRVEGVD